MAETINVIANPKRGACLHEMAVDRFIGCVVDHEETAKTKKNRFKFDPSPVAVPRTAYYVRLVKDGDLLPGDDACAAACGITKASAEIVDAPAKKSR